MTDDKERRQLVITESIVPHVLHSLHNDLGHPGRDKTMSLARDRFFWPGMNQDVETYIKECERCVKRKSTTERAPLHSIQTTQPLELECTDFLTLEMSRGGLLFW